MSFTDIPEEGEGNRTWIAHSGADPDPTVPIYRDNDTLKAKKSKQQQQKTKEEAARDEAQTKVEAEQVKNTVVFPTLTCEYCGEIFKAGEWLFAHQRNDCVQKKALDLRREEWEARKRIYSIKYETLDRKQNDIQKLSDEVKALKLELLENEHSDEACRQVIAERAAEAAKKKAEREEREWYLNASEEERELHYFETTGLTQSPSYSEKIKSLRTAIAKKKMKEKESRVTTKG